MRASGSASRSGEGPGDRALPLRSLAAATLAASALAAGLAACGGSTQSASVTSVSAAQGSRRATELEALLPESVAGARLRKASATGAAVLGGDAFSRSMTSFLQSLNRPPSDLAFANARARSGAVEVGVFDLPGVAGSRLLRAIVDASRPNAPGLTASPAAVAGKAVTKLTYAGGAVLYLRAAGNRVFYVGTRSERLAATVLGELP